jgi:hypothetical protein
MGPVGAVVATGAAVGMNKVAKIFTGQSIDGLAASGVDNVATILNKGGELVGVSEEQEKLLAAKKKCQEQYVAPEREQVKGKGGKEAFAKGREEALRREGLESPTQSVGKTKQRGKSLSKEMQSVKETLSRSESVVETRPRSRSVSSTREV